MDGQTAFLNGDLDEEMYMKQLERFVMPGNEHKFSMKDMGEADVILGKPVDKARILRAIGCLMMLRLALGHDLLKQMIDWILLYELDGCSCLREVIYGLPEANMHSLVLLWNLSLEHWLCCAPTMAKAYSQIYNGKLDPLGVGKTLVEGLVGVRLKEPPMCKFSGVDPMSESKEQDGTHQLTSNPGLRLKHLQ
ncbi:hypothetical protein Tco_0491713 [Tanacetum coccineum]